MPKCLPADLINLQPDKDSWYRKMAELFVEEIKKIRLYHITSHAYQLSPNDIETEPAWQIS